MASAPGLEEFAYLIAVVAAGVHDPEVMPFTIPWTDQEPATRAVSAAQH